MGQGSSSSSSTNIATKAAIDVVVNNIMNCRGNTTGIQSIEVPGNYNSINNVKQVQMITLSGSCSQDAQNMQDLQQSVSAALQNAAASQSVSLLGVLGTSKSDIDQKISNEVSQKLTSNTILNIVNDTNAQQKLFVSGSNNVITNVTQEQTLNILQNNVQNAMNQLSSVQAIETAAKSTSTATQSNFISDIIDSIFSGFTGMSLIWALVVIAGIIAAILLGPKFLDFIQKKTSVAGVVGDTSPPPQK